MKAQLNKYAIIILAAGNSSRLGKPKQLLMFNDKTLLRHIVDESIDAAGDNVVVVLGAHSDQIRPELNSSGVEIVENSEWEDGMASSIRAGVSAMLASQPDTEGIIIAVCDQPFVSSKLLKELMSIKDKAGVGIIASKYDNALGTPALFGKKYFTELQGLNGAHGAKKLLMKYDADLISVPFPSGGTDIDTAEDYNNLKDSHK
jgi:molybdenum cofactor cytidylyltransferase